MRKLLLSLVLLLSWVLFSLNVTAAESTDWLINNPVSMMDWGSGKAKESAQHAADSLNKLMEMRAKQQVDLNDTDVPENVKKAILEGWKQASADPDSPKQYGFEYGSAFSGYDLPRDRIVVGVFVTPRGHWLPTVAGKIDAESCIGIVEDFRKRLVTLSGADSAQQLAADFWFTHSGYKPAAMPANFAKDLAEHITVLIHLDRYPHVNAEITCEEPLPGGPISVVKKKSK
jgi:hypothetical protein